MFASHKQKALSIDSRRRLGSYYQVILLRTLSHHFAFPAQTGHHILPSVEMVIYLLIFPLPEAVNLEYLEEGLQSCLCLFIK